MCSRKEALGLGGQEPTGDLKPSGHNDSLVSKDSSRDNYPVREEFSDRCSSDKYPLTGANSLSWREGSCSKEPACCSRAGHCGQGNPLTGIPHAADFSLESYSFYLPEEQIAQHPAPQRGTSRLLVVHKNTAPLQLEEKVFTDILDVLPENCLLVANNSRVVPARLMGKRASGGKVEFLLLSPLPLLTPCALPLEACQRYGLGGECGGETDGGCGVHLGEVTQGQQENLGQTTTSHNSAEYPAETWQYAEAQGLLRSSKQVKVGDLDELTLGVAEVLAARSFRPGLARIAPCRAL